VGTLTSKALRMARVNEDHIVLPATDKFIQEWDEPSCIFNVGNGKFLPSAVTACFKPV